MNPIKLYLLFWIFELRVIVAFKPTSSECFVNDFSVGCKYVQSLELFVLFMLCVYACVFLANLSILCELRIALVVRKMGVLQCRLK